MMATTVRKPRKSYAKPGASTAWYRANKERAREYHRAYRARYTETQRQNKLRINRERRASTLTGAVPAWADRELIKTIYLRGVQTGMDVDHIVPLVSKLVCGLHTHDNLQLLPRAENGGKGNRWWPDMPGKD